MAVLLTAILSAHIQEKQTISGKKWYNAVPAPHLLLPHQNWLIPMLTLEAGATHKPAFSVEHWLVPTHVDKMDTFFLTLYNCLCAALSAIALTQKFHLWICSDRQKSNEGYVHFKCSNSQ